MHHPDLKLYFVPGACSRVSLIALEEIGVRFDTHLVKVMKGEQKSAEYLRLNPKGKVPTLLVGGEPLTETVAILGYLSHAFPEARLLPMHSELLSDMRVLADMVWCAAGLHPLVTRIRFPGFVCEQPQAQRGVWRIAADAMASNFNIIESRLARQPWMLDEWSILDAYIFWVWGRVCGAGMDVTPYPRFADHAKRIAKRSSVKRALEREREAELLLEREGLNIRYEPLPDEPTPA